MRWLATLLAWGYANVLGNIVASAIWAWPVLLLHHLHVRRRLTVIHGHVERAAQHAQAAAEHAERAATAATAAAPDPLVVNVPSPSPVPDRSYHFPTGGMEVVTDGEVRPR